MDDKLYISIAGRAASGKSTVAMILKECLREYGFEVEFDGGIDYDCEEEFNEFVSKNQEQRLEALTKIKNRAVVLSEIQLKQGTLDEISDEKNNLTLVK